jgi:integrase
VHPQRFQVFTTLKKGAAEVWWPPVNAGVCSLEQMGQKEISESNRRIRPSITDPVIESLITLKNSGTLNDTDAVQNTEMLKKNLENYIKRNHRYAICQTGKGYYQTNCVETLPDGSKHRKTMSAPTKEKLLEQLYKLYSGESAAEKSTIKNLLPLVIDEKRTGKGIRKCTEDTLRHYKNRYDKYIAGSFIDEKPIQRITAADLFTFYQDITGDGEELHGTVSNVKDTINACFDYALRHEIIDVNVSRSITLRGLKFRSRRRKQAYCNEERAQIIGLLRNSRNLYDIAIIFMFCLGCRVGEVLALAWTDIDMNAGEIYIHREQVWTTGDDGKQHLIYRDYCKGYRDSGTRVLKISGLLSEVIASMPRTGDQYIFANKPGQHMQAKFLNRHLKKVCNTINTQYKRLFINTCG